MADYQDLYIERFHPDDPGQYKYKDSWHKAEQYREVVYVRDGNPVEVDITVTHHGPVVIGNPQRGIAIALRYTATAEPNSSFETLLPMLVAKSVEELDEAMEPWVDPCNNLIMADVHGTIGYMTRGKVPIRSMANAWLPVPGWTDEHEWQRMIPFEEMPRSRDPKEGFLVTANNRIVGNDYPHYLALNYVPPFRAARINDRLASLDKSTVDDMAAIHGDRLSIPSQLFIERLKDLQIQDEPSAKAIEHLIQWGGRMDPDSTAATIYIVTRDQLTGLLKSQPKLSPLKTNPFADEPMPSALKAEDRLMWMALPKLLGENDTSLLGGQENWSTLLAEALSRASAWLSDTLGPDMNGWQWGKLHRTAPVHPLAVVYPELGELLNPPSVPLGGDGDTPQAAWIAPGLSYNVYLTSVARYVYDLADWDNSRWIVPLGSSGHPGSPHYSDQKQKWSDIQLVPMAYSWEKIMAENETKQLLNPK
jgi:penicillin amidase